MRIGHRIVAGIVAAALLTAALLALLHHESPPLYKATILSSLGSGIATATGINNRGQIVGYAQAADGRCHLCLWDREGHIEDLGPAVSTFFRINDAGQIAGLMSSLNGKEGASIRDQAGGVHALGSLGGGESVIRGLNNHGQIVGESMIPGGPNRAFVWDQATGMRDLDAPQGSARAGYSQAHGINDSGQIVGVSADGCRVLWASAGTTAIDTQFRGPPFSNINNHVYIVGRQWFHGAGQFLVLRRPGGDPKKLFSVEERTEFEFRAVVNDANQVLFAEVHHRLLERIARGRLLPSNEYYLWDPNQGCLALNPCVLTRRGETLELFGLNNDGCIVGRVMGHDAMGTITYMRAVLLEPIPERWRK
jgi:probable HAF family extracellular repeat protein